MAEYEITPRVARRLENVQRLLINGQWQAASDGRTESIYNPSTGEIITTAASAAIGDADKAVAAARASFDNHCWTSLTPAHRARVLWQVADLIEANAEEIAELEMLDAGKFYLGALNGEVPFAAECFRYYAGWCTKIEGTTKQLSIVPDQAFHIYTQREPIGVAALIVPWNGPLVQAAWKIAPALAAGCSVVIKPASLTPLSVTRLGELMIEAGVPDGVINIIPGSGSTIGRFLAEHPDVDKVSFTGSTEVGKQILDSAKGNLKKLTLELGGKSPVIVFDDADLDLAIEGAAGAIFSSAGQVCVAGSRLYVQDSVYDQVVEGVADIARKLKVGPATNSDMEMGPLISLQHMKGVHRMVETGRDEGARVVAGGNLLTDQDGYFMEPTVLADTTHDMSVVSDEIFGPVLVAMPFSSHDDIAAVANDSEFGLAASIWTRDISKAHLMAAAIRAGLVWINCHGIPDMAIPFGGYKQSGWGRENGYESLLQYTELKSVVARL